ncbi:hypothetical protein ACFOWM_06120 [Ferruginibacter yonginensis]|uniref:Uncharacterized protein n=1 Tax=Ferruginibacter yonginensis TaxID=1310416 RepID=A0ABV8QS52_9BACT
MQKQYQQQRPMSQTHKDVSGFKNIISRVCYNTKITADAYQMFFFDYGCKFIEHIYKDDYISQMKILTQEKLGFWKWFLIKYIKHDEDLHNSNVPYRNYMPCKEMFIHSLRLADDFVKHLKTK